jgi:hypothetical protein
LLHPSSSSPLTTSTAHTALLSTTTTNTNTVAAPSAMHDEAIDPTPSSTISSSSSSSWSSKMKQALILYGFPAVTIPTKKQSFSHWWTLFQITIRRILCVVLTLLIGYLSIPVVTNLLSSTQVSFLP